jgi:hypothetical protein
MQKDSFFFVFKPQIERAISSRNDKKGNETEISGSPIR